MKYLEQLHIDPNQVRLFNYKTNGYYGFLSEFDITNFKNYEIIKSKVQDEFIEIYIQEKEV